MVVERTKLELRDGGKGRDNYSVLVSIQVYRDTMAQWFVCVGCKGWWLFFFACVREIVHVRWRRRFYVLVHPVRGRAITCETVETLSAWGLSPTSFSYAGYVYAFPRSSG